MVVEEIKDTYGVNPYTTSLKVYTTLDRSKQDAVDRVMKGQSSFQFADDQIDTGVAVLDVKTGAIQAVAAVTVVVVVQAAVRAAAVQVAMEAETPVVAVLLPDGE